MVDNGYKDGVYIPSIDGKDLYLANNFIDTKQNGYRLRRYNNEYNLMRFKNSLDYSLDLIRLRQVFDKAYDSDVGQKFSFFDGDKEYSYQVINVTFKYSVKEFNMISKDIYIRVGYSVNDATFRDCVGYNDKGEIIAVETNKDVHKIASGMPDYFKFVQGDGDLYGHYAATGGIPTILSRADVRKWIYKEGFDCEGIHFVRFKRSSGSARIGHCNFVNEKLYPSMHAWEQCGVVVKNGQKIDLAAWESYISLTASSIIDTIQINPDSILVIDDYDSKFVDTVMATKVADGHLFTEPETIEVKNSIWDGQSLIDESAMGDYAKYGMILMRNRFFKSCCFNTNIQRWFLDNGITDVSQLNGYTRAKRIEDIKIITTPSSIKYVKFGTLGQWLDNIEPTFGIVKHEKKPKFLNGTMVQTHYQLLNTLQLTFEETKKLLQPSLEYIFALRDDPAVLRNHLKFSTYKDGSIIAAKDKNAVIYSLMNLNDRFPETKIYAEFVNTLVRSQLDNLKLGHVLVNGNYSTLFGNPLEMLQSAIGKFTGESQLGVGNIHCTRFRYGRRILGSRSPHVTIGNVWLPFNVENAELDKYFNLTSEICCMNSINENVLARLSGSDYDSDTSLLTDNDLLINVAVRNYDKFLVPTSLVSADKMNRYFTDEQKADLDFKTSVNKIGEIINFSQILNSLLWDNIANGETLEQNMDLYADISQLDVMSNLEIDKAKKIFEVDNSVELKLLKAKYKLENEDGLETRPKFFMHVAKKKGYYIKGKKDYIDQMTTMDYVQRIVDRSNSLSRAVKVKRDKPISYVLDMDMYDKASLNRRHMKTIVDLMRSLNAQRRDIFALSSVEYSRPEKRLLYDRVEYNCIRDVSAINLNFSTAAELLKLSEQKQYRDIRTYLFYMMLSLPSTRFFSIFDESKDNVLIIEPCDEQEADCHYYGKPYRHVVDTGDGIVVADVDEIVDTLKFENIAPRIAMNGSKNLRGNHRGKYGSNIKKGYKFEES